MAYDTPTRISHYLSAAALSTAAGTALFTIKGPKGMKGRLVDVVGAVTTTTTGTPNLGFGTNVGAAGTRIDIAEVQMGARTAPFAYTASADDPTFKSRSGNTAKGKIAADVPVIVSMSTAGGAGVANLTAVIEWYF